MENKGDIVNYVEEVGGKSLEKTSSNELFTAAQLGSQAEHETTLRQAFRRWPRAVLWAFVFCSTIIMEGYDTLLIPSLIGYPSFKEHYGEPFVAKTGKDAGKVVYAISAPWQGGLNGAILVTNCIGVILGGTFAEKYGYKPVFLSCLSLMVVFIFGTFFSRNMTELLIAEALCGLPWGAFSTLGPAYASEIAPLALRGYLTVFTNASWLIGQCFATGILAGLVERTDKWGFKIPFAIQWVWPVPILIAVMLAPESPWWLVKQGRLEDAKRAIDKCVRKGEVDVDNHVAMMVETNEIEKKVSSGTSYLQCFKGVDLRRTEVSTFAWAIQTVCGNPFAGSAIFFFTTVGLSPKAAYSLGVGQFALGLVGTILSWFLLSFFGRRSIFIGGLTVMSALMFVIGICAIPTADAATWAQASLMIVWTFVYDLTVGPIAYSIVCEHSSTRLRAKTVGLGRVLYNIVGLLCSLIQPYFINPTSAAYIGGKVGFIWGAVSIGCVLWAFFRLPESRGKLAWELDHLYATKVPARKFATTKVALEDAAAHH